MEKIEINFRVKNVEMSAKEYINVCKQLILKLKSTLSNINHIYTFEKDEPFYFSNDLSDFDTNNLYEIISVNKDEDVYQNTNKGDIHLYENSRSWIGFNSLFLCKENLESEDNNISFSISSLGAYEKDKFSVMKVEFSDEYQSKLNFEIIEKIINIFSETIKLDFAVVYTDEFFDEVFNVDYQLWIGWITFINKLEVEKYLPINIISEKISNGYLFSFSKEKVDSTNKAIIEESITLTNNLGRQGLLNYPFKN